MELPSNVTKSLSINSYRLCSTKDKDAHLQSVDKQYGTSYMIKMIEDISKLIDSNILYTLSHQFQPYGCGKVSPLNSLDYLLTTLDPHLIVVDYKERGFSYEGNTKEFGEKRDVNQYVKDLKKYYIQTKDQAHVLMLSHIGDPLIEEEVKEIRNGI